jgi:hypothetical protein
LPSQKKPKYLQQTTFETLNFYNKPCYETAYLGKNVINLLKQKVAQKVAIIFGYFILSKNHKEPPKAAQLSKNDPIWSPCPSSSSVFRIEIPAK